MRMTARGLALVVTLLMLSACQRQLIYFPSRAAEPELLAQAPRIGLQAWRDAGGRLIGWRSASERPGTRRILVFHGNAGYAQHRRYFAAGLQHLREGWDVYLFEYPGYGARPGTPAESTIKAAAREALDALPGSRIEPVYLIGESLGSGVACHLAAVRPERIGGMLLVTPFTSLPDLAAEHYPAILTRWLLSERYDCAADLRSYAGPVAFLLAGQDEIVPTRLGQQLYDGYPGPKWLRIDSRARHNTVDYAPSAAWWGEVSGFLTGQGR